MAWSTYGDAVTPSLVTVVPLPSDACVLPAKNLTATSAPVEPKYPGLISFSTEYMHMHGYISVIVCIFGIIANMANVIILTRKNMISSTNLILTWLAVADLLTMSSYLPVSIHFYIMKDPRLHFPSTPSLHWIQFMLFHINFTVVCHTVAIWLTINLAMFRYLYICFPTRGQTLCSIQRAKLAIIAIYVATMIICIPNYLVNAIKKDCQPHDVPQVNTNTSMMSSSSSNNSATQSHEKSGFYYYHFSHSDIAKPYLSNINYWIQAFLIKLIPCALLTVLTILLIIAMHNANKRRMKLKSQGKKDESDRAREHNRTTAMLLAIVVLFLLTELPQGILTLCSIFIPNFFEQVYVPLGDLLDIMALLNNAINFVLYCSMSQAFRDTFVNTFCGCCPEKRPGWLQLKSFSVNSNGTQTTSCASQL